VGSELVRRYAAALGARDWDAFAALLADDVVYRLPQTGEVVRGREASCATTARSRAPGS
jgi:ketosteroid isomerase-like protein